MIVAVEIKPDDRSPRALGANLDGVTEDDIPILLTDLFQSAVEVVNPGVYKVSVKEREVPGV